MKYNYKEYKHIFDTPAKMEQETVVVNKIMELLNKNKYDSIYEFVTKNQTYQDFLKKNELENVVKHFGNTLNETDYKNILNEIIKLTEKKKDFDKESIKTTNIDDKEYTSYKGEDKTYFLDNSHSNKSIEAQMKDMQSNEQKFQTSDTKENTENMMKELEKNKKENLNLEYLKDINVDSLSEYERTTFNIATNYQLDMQNLIRVDLERQIIVDEFDNIMKIEITNGEISIIGDDNKEIEIESEDKEIEMSKSFQKTLTPSPNTIYSNNN